MHEKALYLPFNYILTTFLGLEHVSCIAVYAGSENSGFIKNILICVSKMKVLLVWNDMWVCN